MKRKLNLLLTCALILALSLGCTVAGSSVRPAEDRELKLEAAHYMERAMERVRAYKEELGIPESPEDRFHTGLIGEEYNGITTTLGPPEAKRTASDPNMAALVVDLLRRAGVRPGDRVAAGFSGSFPGFDLAVLSAAAAMELDLTYMVAVGSSTHGANWPKLTFPEIALRLVEDGVFPTRPALWSLGGQMDCGLDMDPELVAAITGRMEGTGLPLLREEDFTANIDRRMDLILKDGPIRCFLGAGGNMTVTGRGERELGCGLLMDLEKRPIDDGSGLAERFGARGVPVIYLLNVKHLAADYGLPYDPEVQQEPGSGPLYEAVHYPALPALLGLAGAGWVLLRGFGKKREEPAQ